MDAFSYVHNPGTKPLVYKSIPDLFYNKIKEKGDFEAFVHHKSDGSRHSINTSTLKEKSQKFAGFLARNGIKPGDRLAICGPNSINWVIGELGIIIAGAVSVHVSIGQYNATDVLEILHLTKCRMLLVDTGENGEYRSPLTHILKSWILVGVSLAENVRTVLLRRDDAFENYRSIESIINTHAEETEFPIINPEDPCAVFTTSGTSGKPKMVEYLHFSLGNYVMANDIVKENNVSSMYNDRPFVWLGGYPIFNICFGQKRIFTDTAMRGSSINTIWDIIQLEKCCHAFMCSYLLDDLMRLKKGKNNFKPKYLITGGQAFDAKYLKLIGEVTEYFITGYGSTEVSGVSHIGFENANDSYLEGNTGKPAPFVEVKIVDAFGKITRQGNLGDICVRSPLMMRRYLCNEEANVQAFIKGGWIRIGDIGYISSEGDIVVRGRTKDIISRGTRKIIPQSIEEIILKMKGIQSVIVVAVPDERLHEEVCTCFVSEPDSVITPDDVEQYCRKKFLGEEAVDGLGQMPKYFLKFERFPNLSNGKIDKNCIKRKAIKRL